MDDEVKALGARIRELRKKRHLSQEQLGKKCRLHYQHIAGIEKATANPTLAVLRAIAKALGANLRDLFHYEPLDPEQLRRQLAQVIRECSESELRQLHRFYHSQL